MDNRNVIKHSRKHKDGRTPEMCRSVYDYPRDVSCSSRKKAYRNSHHRRRQINREELINNVEEAQILKSTTCVQKRVNGLPMPLKGKSTSTISRSLSYFNIKPTPYKPGLKRNKSNTKLIPYININFNLPLYALNSY